MIFLIVLLSISILPVIWINYVFKKNDEILPNMPFNGIEFGNQLIKELELKDVCLEKTLIGDHYDLDQRKVKVGEDRLRKKSLTSISISSASGKISKTFTLSWSITKISFSLIDSPSKAPITSTNSTPVCATISLDNVYASLETPTPNAALSENPRTLVDSPLILIMLPLSKLWGAVTIPTNVVVDLDGIVQH